jgi:hypothetical protein
MGDKDRHAWKEVIACNMLVERVSSSLGTRTCATQNDETNVRLTSTMPHQLFAFISCQSCMIYTFLQVIAAKLEMSKLWKFPHMTTQDLYVFKHRDRFQRLS